MRNGRENKSIEKENLWWNGTHRYNVIFGDNYKINAIYRKTSVTKLAQEVKLSRKGMSMTGRIPTTTKLFKKMEKVEYFYFTRILIEQRRGDFDPKGSPANCWRQSWLSQLGKKFYWLVSSEEIPGRLYPKRREKAKVIQPKLPIRQRLRNPILEHKQIWKVHF